MRTDPALAALTEALRSLPVTWFNGAPLERGGIESIPHLAAAILTHPAMKDVVLLGEDIDHPDEVIWGRFACRLCGRERYGDD